MTSLPSRPTAPPSRPARAARPTAAVSPAAPTARAEPHPTALPAEGDGALPRTPSALDDFVNAPTAPPASALQNPNLRGPRAQPAAGRPIGLGGAMGVYFLHRNGEAGGADDERRVVHKVPLAGVDVGMLRREDLASSLRHPHIVEGLGIVARGSALSYAMTYVDGASCADLLRDEAAKGRAFPPEVAASIGDAMLDALAYVHDAKDDLEQPLDIVHCDISPGNILIGKDGVAKLADFGIARWRGSPPDPDAIEGKPGYMSPEQRRGDDVDRRSDLFSLGVVLAEMLLGKRLFRDADETTTEVRAYTVDLAPIREATPPLPAPIVAVLERALARSPDDRFADAREFRAALNEAAKAEGLPVGIDVVRAWFTARG